MADTGADALLVAPEPAPWLTPVLQTLTATMRVEVFAPWVLPRGMLRVAGGVGFVRRRAGAEVAAARGQGWFTAAELLARVLARGRTAATFANRVRLRALVDAAAARRLARSDVPHLVIAPSFAARRTFAFARRSDGASLLIEDMPDFDTLVDGLDALAARLPEAAFLRNHRPTARAHARQRAERYLADAIAVRGRAAWRRVGAQRTRVLLPRAPHRQGHPPGPEILFAGPPLARCGSMHLPALLEALPGRVIRVQPGPCSEPAELAAHPRIRVDDRLDGVGVVLSLGSLESHPAAVERALDAGIPVVGTLASTGRLDPDSIVAVAGERTRETASAVEAALRTDAPRPRAWTPPRTLAAWLSASFAAAAQ